MITVRLVPEPGSQQALDKMFDDIDNVLRHAPPLLMEVGFGCAHDVLKEVFEGEGASAVLGTRRWERLGPYYLLERARRGFPYGTLFPILVNTGALRASLIEESDAGHIVERRNEAYRSIGRLGTDDPKFEFHQHGGIWELPSGIPWLIPARPMWFTDRTGDAEDRFLDFLENECLEAMGALV